jgi:hypothetical protein
MDDASTASNTQGKKRSEHRTLADQLSKVSRTLRKKSRQYAEKRTVSRRRFVLVRELGIRQTLWRRNLNYVSDARSNSAGKWHDARSGLTTVLTGAGPMASDM